MRSGAANSGSNGRASGSLPVTRGSGVDSELERLMRAHPNKTRELLYDLYNISHHSKDKSSKQAPADTSNRGRLGQTHYQETYTPKGGRMRSSKRPEYDPPIAGQKQAQGSYETSQRAEFVPKDLAAARNDPVRKSDSGQGGTEQLLKQPQQQGQLRRTVYQEEYPVRELEPQSERAEAAKASANRPSQVLVPAGRFQAETTSNATYRGWATGRNQLHYGELPVFIGSVLNPGNQRELQTVMQSAYTGPSGAPAAAAVPATGNISVDGSYDFTTVNREAYKPLPPGNHREPAIRRNNETIVERKVPMNGETQTRADYKGHDTNKFKRPQRAAQALDSVHLSFDSKGYYGTEQRQNFPGYDVRNHPMPASFKKDPSTYTRPEGQMATETTTHDDYREMNISDAYRERVKPPQATTRFAGKFGGETTNRDSYQPYEHDSSPRIRHGDFHMAYHQSVPKLVQLQGQSETKERYVPQPIQATESCKPLKPTLGIEGDHDFRTVHQTAYTRPKFRLTREQAAAVKAELLRLEAIRARQGDPTASGTSTAASGEPLPGITSC